MARHVFKLLTVGPTCDDMVPCKRALRAFGVNHTPNRRLEPKLLRVGDKFHLMVTEA
jgi:hypothetical protein